MQSLTLLLAAAGVVYGQHGNHGSPVSISGSFAISVSITNRKQFPDTTYPNATSPNPAALKGAQSNQTSPPYYPSPWGNGDGDWAGAYEKAIALVKQLTLEEKVNLTTGTGWELDRCVGQTGSIPRLGLRALCLQDSPTGVRDTDFVSVSLIQSFIRSCSC